MKYIQYTKPLMIAIFFVLSMFTVNPVAALPIVDVPVAVGTAAVITEFKLIFDAANRLDRELKQLDDKLERNEPGLINISKKIEDSTAALLKWRETSDPSEAIHNGLLNSALIIPMNQFKIIVNREKTELSKLEASNFLSSDLSDQKNSAYTFGDTGYDDIIGKEAMCPPPAPAFDTSSFSYAELQYDACRTVHNVMTYKKRKLEFTLEKKDQLEKAILAVSDVKDKTIGDHTAKQTVIAELKLLQQEVMDQYNVKMQFADVQIKASEGSRKYAAESIVGGSSVSAKPTNIKDFKLAAELAIQTFMTLNPPVPYH